MILKPGDKVVPISKSFGCNFNKSGCFDDLKVNKEYYLIFIGIRNNHYYCVDEKRYIPGVYNGNLFLKEDLLPYV